MILIVDDKPENILPLRKILELHRFAVDTAGSGEEALRKVLQHAYSVIILDVQMPGMDGFEVASAISGFSKTKDTSIIFLSAVNVEKQFITKGYTAGGVDYLTKPVDPDVLILKVKTLQKLYNQQQELRVAQELLRKEVEVRKQAQEQLAAQVQDLQSLLASLPQMAFTVSAGGALEYVNVHWFEYAEKASVFPAIHPDDVCSDWLGRMQDGHEFSCELRLQNRSTSAYRYHQLRMIPIWQQTVLTRWIGTLTDIHPLKQAAELLEQQVERRTNELRQKNAELEQTNHELQQFSWVVSHDLKEPLRKIQLLNDTIKEKYLNNNPDAVAYLDRSIKSSARMSNLINDLLTYSRLSAPEGFQSTDVNALVQELLLDFDDTISRRNAVVRVGVLPVLDGVPTRIRQVFQNLISNALKFARPDVPLEIDIRAERIAERAIEAPPDAEGMYWRIVVADNGIGFDEKFRERIFVIFQRLHSRSSYEGTGIGLAIAKKNIDKHHGLIAASSQPDQGARFIIVLPAVQNPLPATDPSA